MVGAESMPVTLTTEKDSLSRVAWMMTRSPESVLEGVEPWLWMLEAEYGRDMYAFVGGNGAGPDIAMGVRRGEVACGHTISSLLVCECPREWLLRPLTCPGGGTGRLPYSSWWAPGCWYVTIALARGTP